MKKSEFLNTITMKLPEYLPEGSDYTIEVVQVPKTNMTIMEGITIKSGSNIAPVIYTDPFWELYETGTLSMNDMLEKISDIYKDGMAEVKGVDVSELLDKDDLILCAINAKANTDLLKTTPHMDYGDLALVVRVAAHTGEDMQASALVNYGLLEHWGMTPEELFNKAFETQQTSRQTVIADMMSMIMGIQSGDETELITKDNIDRLDINQSMFVVSTPDKFYGASAIADKGFLDAIADKLDSNLMIIPSSIHEILVLPESTSMSIDDLLKMVSEVNSECVKANEILGDSIYKFDKETKEITCTTKDHVEIKMDLKMADTQQSTKNKKAHR